MIFKKLFLFFGKRWTAAFLLLNFSAVICAVLETISLIGIAYLFTALSRNGGEGQADLSYVNAVAEIFFGHQHSHEKLIVLVPLIFCIATLFNLVVFYSTQFFTIRTGTALSEKLLRHYLVEDALSEKPTDKSLAVKEVVQESHRFATGLIQPSLTALSKFTLAILVCLALALTNLEIFLYSGIGLVGIFLLIYLITAKPLNNHGILMLNTIEGRAKLASEALWGSFEARHFNKVETEIKKFADINNLFVVSQVMSKFIPTIAKPIIELTAVSLVLLIFGFSIVNGDFSVEGFLTKSVIWVIAAFRLLPAIQQVFSCVSIIRVNFPTFKLIEISESKGLQISPCIHSFQDCSDKTPMIRCNHLTFGYPGSASEIISSLDLTIYEGDVLAITGGSGSGKSTLCDLIVGNLKPTSGTIQYSTAHFPKNLSYEGLASYIGCVSQEPYIFDRSIGDNISYEEKTNFSDTEKVNRLIKAFHLETLCNTNTHNAGEGGTQISGGQRQRLAIARCLYAEPSILILDESTNSVEANLQEVILSEIRKWRSVKAIILIAHRESAISSCTRVLNLDHQKLSSQN